MSTAQDVKRDHAGYPIDENFAVPESVKAAARAAEELHKRVYSQQQPPTDAPKSEAVVPTVGTEPAPVTPEVTAAPPVTLEKPSEPAPAPAPKVEDWEHKFNSMKGRFDRSEQQRRQLNDRISGLENVIASLQTPPEPVQPAELDAKSLLTAAEREAYGEDFINTAAKIARQTVHPDVAKLQNEIKFLKDQLTNVNQNIGQNARERMHDMLTQAVPNWLVINDKPEFTEWLAFTDTYSGAIRHDLLKQAYAANDGPRVLSFFKGFLAEEAATAPPTTTAPPAADLTAHKVPLETLAAPGRAKTAAAPPTAPAEKPIFTRAFVTQFYIDCAQGRYQGREEERQRIDRQIIEAGNERRIR